MELSELSLPIASVEKIRNVAIIAHVDHGKTTLVDELLKQSGKQLNVERVMDSNVLEKERGITILSKYTSLLWKEIKINLLDTPGHGDFGGEVERIVNMVDGVVLLVDATEGVMPQTKYVLSKALKAGLQVIVVLNKMDRIEKIQCEEVENEIFDLFLSLGATDNQMDYPTLYASAKNGWALKNRTDPPMDMSPLFDAILSYIPPPSISVDPRFSMLVSTMESDSFVGRILTGRVTSGTCKLGSPLHALDLEGKVVEEAKVFKILARNGLERFPLEIAKAGDIVGISGFSRATVTHTLCDPTITNPVKTHPIDPPVISIVFSVNNSPLAGREGKQCTFPTIKRRLEKEMESNVSLVIKQVAGREAMEVFGRGEMQLGILIENMRREGFEFSVFPPQVVFKQGEDGRKLEPLEEVTVDVNTEYSGTVIQKLALRKAELLEMKEFQGKSRLIFHCTSRSLMGFRSELMTDTRGSAIFNHVFHSYVPYQGKLEVYKKGALISMADGIATAYALVSLEPRGILFIGPGAKVYAGMVIGECTREENLEVNPTKTKHVSNVRSVMKDDAIRLQPARIMSLEEAISYVRDDECLEITPENIRLRKIKAKGK